MRRAESDSMLATGRCVEWPISCSDFVVSNGLEVCIGREFDGPAGTAPRLTLRGQKVQILIAGARADCCRLRHLALVSRLWNCIKAAQVSR